MDGPRPSCPSDTASALQRNPPAVHHAPLTPLGHTRLGYREPEPVGQHRAIDKIDTGLGSQADGQHQHTDTPAAARDEAHPLLDGRKARSVITATRPSEASSTGLNSSRTKSTPTPGTRGAAGKSDTPVIVTPSHAPTAHATPSPRLTNEPADDSDDMKRVPMTTRERWARAWPSLLAVVTLSAVGGPAAVASYRHARDVITQHGDPVMAPWLALTTDGMLLAALVVIWVRRHRGEPVKAGPWAAFWAGMTVTIAANLAAAHPTPIGIVVALWPPVCLAITLELVALVAYPAKKNPIATGARRGEWTGHVPDHPPTAPGHAPAEPAAKTISSPAGQPTVPEHTRLASGTEPGHQASQNGHSHHAPTAGAPDDHILAWLREQERTTGQVPGRRHVIEQWALGSTRADRLRAIVIKEAGSTAPTPAG